MPNEYFIDNNGVRIHAAEFNSTQIGIPLIMVPGMCNAAENIAENVGNLFTGRTIVLSIRGRGKSDSPEIGWSVEHQASDVAAVVNFFEFPMIVLFGHSTGGSIAARAIPMIQSKIAGFIIGDFPPVYPAYSTAWAERVKKNGLSISETALEGIVREAKNTVVTEYLDGLGSNLLAITGDPEKSLLKAEDLSRLQQLFPSITVERLLGCGHEFLSDAPELSMQIIERFIEKV